MRTKRWKPQTKSQAWPVCLHFLVERMKKPSREWRTNAACQLLPVSWGMGNNEARPDHCKLLRTLIHRQAREALRWLGLSALLHIVTMTCTPRLACWRTPGTSATARQQPAVPFGIWMNLVKVRITSYAQPDLPAHRLMSWIQFFLKFILQSFITPLL